MHLFTLLYWVFFLINSKPQADEVLSYIVDFQVTISDANDTYNDVSDDVKHYSNIRKAVTAAILVLPLVLTALSLAGVAFKIKILLKMYFYIVYFNIFYVN